MDSISSPNASTPAVSSNVGVDVAVQTDPLLPASTPTTPSHELRPVVAGIDRTPSIDHCDDDNSTSCETWIDVWSVKKADRDLSLIHI